MLKGLAYFKEVYDTVPGWVQKMHDYSPEVLNFYTALRSEIMKDGALVRKEKDILLASMNAARNYERSMVYHTKGAIDFGATLEELVEYFLVSYLYSEDALKKAAVALQYAQSIQEIIVELSDETKSALEYLKLFQSWLPDHSTYIDEVIATIGDNKAALEAKILEDGFVSSKMKHLAMVGNFTAELDGKGAASWIERARQAGASEAELADVGYICVLTAGIPAWFEISDLLHSENE